METLISICLLMTPDVRACYLIELMGDDNFFVREKASELTKKLGLAAVPYVKSASKKHQDLEVKKRCRDLLEDPALMVLPTRWKGEKKYPWIDSLPKDFPARDEIINKYLEKSREIVGREAGGDWYDYRIATKLWVDDLFSDKRPAKEIIEILDNMVQYESPK